MSIANEFYRVRAEEARRAATAATLDMSASAI